MGTVVQVLLFCALLALPADALNASASSGIWRKGRLSWMMRPYGKGPSTSAPRSTSASSTLAVRRRPVRTVSQGPRQELSIRSVDVPHQSAVTGVATIDSTITPRRISSSFATQGAAALTAVSSGHRRRLLQATNDVTSDTLIKRVTAKLVTVYCFECKVTTDLNQISNPGVVVLPNDRNIVIQGYKVTLTTGGISARGKNVSIIASTLDCDNGNVTGINCPIDVSGKDGADPPAQPTKAQPGGTGTDASWTPDNGGDGGVLSINAGYFSGNIWALYRGGDGSKGQIGGNGGDGGKGASSDNRCNGDPDKDKRGATNGVWLGCQWTTENQYDACGWEKQGGLFSTTYCLQVEWSGKDGDKGGTGGNAGKNGANGNGGQGGMLQVAISSFLPNTPSSLLLTGRAGKGGKQTQMGQPGDGGDGGDGGCPVKKKVRRINIASCELDCFDCAAAADSYKARYGAAGAKGDAGTNPYTLPAAGQDGTSIGTRNAVYLNISDWRSLNTAPEWLSLVLNKARDAFLSADTLTATDRAKFLDAVSGSCLPADADQCQQVGEQARAMIYRLANGHSYYGTPPGWVPTLSLGVITNFLKNTLLPSLQTVEAANSKLLSQGAALAEKQKAYQDTIDKTSAQISNMADEIDRLTTGISTNMDTLKNTLLPARTKYRGDLYATASAFESAIKKKQASDKMWLVLTLATDLVSFVTITMSAGYAAGFRGADRDKALAAATAGTTASSGKAVLQDINDMLNPPKELTNIAVFEDTTPQGAQAAWSQAQADAGDPEAARILVDKERLDSLLDAYMDLDAGWKYRGAVAAFNQAAQNYNDMLDQISHQIATKLQLESDKAALEQQLAAVQNDYASTSDPTIASSIALSNAMLRSMQDLTLYYLYQRRAAANYVQLKLAPMYVTGVTYNDLTILNTLLESNIIQNIGLLSPSQLTTFSPIFLNKDTLPGFQDMLDDGTILFSLNPCMSQFRGFSNIRVRKVSITVIGAKALLPSPYESPLYAYFIHPGRGFLQDKTATRYSFSHTERQTVHAYDVTSGRVISQGVFDYDIQGQYDPADPYSAVYISVSPLTDLQIQLRPDINQAVDLSGVTGIRLDFTGTAQPLTTNNCPLACYGSTLTTPTNSDWSACTTVDVNTTCVGGCKSGWAPSTTPIKSLSPPRATCSSKGTFTVNGSCVAARCLASKLPSAPGNSSWPCGDTAASGVCTGVCDDGFQRGSAGAPTTTCNPVTGNWNTPTGSCIPIVGVSCAGTLPRSPANSTGFPTSCRGRPDNFTCTSGCVGNFTGGMWGFPSTTCTNGVWTNVTGSCVRACNGTLPAPPVGASAWPVTCKGQGVNSTCQASCLTANYTDGPLGPPTSTCGSNGAWLAVRGSCVQRCSAALPAKPANAYDWSSDCQYQGVGFTCRTRGCLLGFAPSPTSGTPRTNCTSSIVKGVTVTSWQNPVGACVPVCDVDGTGCR